jgi:anti-sigma regulatory factor (Ser/Thr protein kinase)
VSEAALHVDFVPERKLDALRDILAAVDDAKASSGGGPEWFDIKLAIEEACTNIMEHGYGTEAGPIELALRADDDRIVVSIRDEAAPFSPGEAAPADLLSEVEDRQPGGLGWHLIQQLMDGIEYESAAGSGNHLTLIKRRNRPEGNDGSHV